MATNDGQAIEAWVSAGAKLLRYWRIPNPEAPHVEAKNPAGLPDWSRISDGGNGASAGECIAWLKGEGATVAGYVRRVVEPHNRKYPDKPIEVPANVLPGIGVLPASLGKLVVDVDLASKKALATMRGPGRQRRSIAGYAAVVGKLRKPDGEQRSPSGGLHCYSCRRHPGRSDGQRDLGD